MIELLFKVFPVTSCSPVHRWCHEPYIIILKAWWHHAPRDIYAENAHSIPSPAMNAGTVQNTNTTLLPDLQ
jgi:hypothetical protein